MTDSESVALIQRVVAGDREAAHVLAGRLTPLIQRTVGSCLLQCRALQRGDARQIALDLIQQVFVTLFRNDMRVLRQWDPARGRTLTSFVALVARREVWSVLRSDVRSPFTEEPTETDDAVVPRPGAPSVPLGPPSPDEVVIGSQLMASLTRELRERQGERGVLLLQLVVVDGCSAEEVSTVTGMSVDAIHAWHSRLRRMVRQIQQTSVSGDVESPRTAGKARP